MKIAATASRGALLALTILLFIAASAQAATVTEFSEGITLPAGPVEIAAGPDGNLWFTEIDGDAIGRITPTGVVTEFLDGISEGSSPLGITNGPDGNLWFTEVDAGRIGRITPAGVVTEFSAGITPGSNPRAIVTGADNNLWYADGNGRRIGRITTAGVVTEFPITGSSSGPLAITRGSDGNVWWTELGAIGRITPAGDVTRFPGPYSFALGIAAGPDNNLWVTESFGPIRRVNTAGTVTGTFALPADMSPLGITAGPDGNMWFTDSAYDSIGRITPAGAIAIVSTGVSLGSDPRDIVTGADGNLWFTEQSLDQIGRVTPSIAVPAVGAGDATAVTTTTATLNGSVNPDGVETLARFEYGTTTAYGSQTEVQFVADTVAEPVIAALTGLQPHTTYHYRLVAAGGGGSAQSADRTFRTAAVTQPPPPPPPAACSNGVDDDRDGFADSADPRCHADGNPRNAASYQAQGTSEAPVDDPARVCRSGGLALVSAERTSQGRRVRLRGVADPGQAGQRVGLYAGGRRVGNALVRANGSFTGSLAAPRRGAAGLRYQARLGTQRSQSLAVQRRLAGVRLTVTGGRVVLSGRTVGRRPRSVELLGREGCGAFKRLATAQVSRTGRFSLSAAAFGGVDIATYRVRILAAGAAGAREGTPPRAIVLR